MFDISEIQHIGIDLWGTLDKDFFILEGSTTIKYWVYWY